MQFLTFYTPSTALTRAAQQGIHGPDEQADRRVHEVRRTDRHRRPHSAPAGRARRSDSGNVTITDGPYIESTEIIGGFAMLEVPSKEAAIESSKRFLKIAGDGQVTIRPLDEAA